jgi:hypothetical protein
VGFAEQFSVDRGHRLDGELPMTVRALETLPVVDIAFYSDLGIRSVDCLFTGKAFHASAAE